MLDLFKFQLTLCLRLNVCWKKFSIHIQSPKNLHMIRPIEVMFASLRNVLLWMNVRMDVFVYILFKIHWKSQYGYEPVLCTLNCNIIWIYELFSIIIFPIFDFMRPFCAVSRIYHTFAWSKILSFTNLPIMKFRIIPYGFFSIRINPYFCIWYVFR